MAMAMALAMALAMAIANGGGEPRLVAPPASAGRGAYAIRALPDLCLGIVSRRLGRLLQAC
jgi:hypothetical protein